MLTYSGGCYCGNIRYELTLDSPDEARISICHCTNCRARLSTGLASFILTHRTIPEIHRLGIRRHRESPQARGPRSV